MTNKRDRGSLVMKDDSTENDFLNYFIGILEERYSNTLYRRAVGILRDSELAATALNDTWLHIVKYWKIQSKVFSL